MFARISKVEFPPGAVSEQQFHDFARDKPPEITHTPGQRYGFWVSDLARGIASSIAIWDSEAALDRTEAPLRAKLEAGAKALGGRLVSLERFAVLVPWTDLSSRPSGREEEPR